MRFVKISLIILAVLLVAVLVLGLFQPREFNYEYSTVVQAPKEVVFAQLEDLRKWEEWGPWQQSDTTLSVTYGEQTSGLGASYSWTSELSGNGTMTIVHLDPPNELRTELDFEGQGGGKGYFLLEDAPEGGTLLKWGFSFQVPYPFNAFMVFQDLEAHDTAIEEEFNRGLANIKNLAEAEAMSSGNYQIREQEMPARKFIIARQEVKLPEIASFFAEKFGLIHSRIQDNKIEMAGAPCGIYFTFDEANGVTDMAAAMPIPTTASWDGDLETFEIPAGPAFVLDHYGAYEKLGDAHNALDAYLAQRGLAQQPLVVEEYLTDPGAEPDTSKWLTRIYYYVPK